MPDLSIHAQVLFRASYSALLLITLLLAFREGRRFLLSDRWGGYAASSRWVNLLHNPYALPIISGVWIGSAILLAINVLTIPAALVNLLLCRYYFIHMRWRGILRGMGAPGFMTYWLGGAVLLIEVSSAWTPHLLPMTVLVLQADYALIMLSSGIYKMTAGYPKNHGMEYGMANPQWGYWWKYLSRLRPSHWFFWFCNQMAWSVQIASAALMLIPQTRLIGALMIAFSFLFINTQIRLGTLCPMVILGALLFVPADSFLNSVLVEYLPVPVNRPNTSSIPANASLAFKCLLATYLIILPVAYAGLYFNFYSRRRLPYILQKCLDVYTNCFGLIIWRVFSVDVVNFFIYIYEHTKDDRRKLISDFGRVGSRFNHVGEAITLTSIFTTLKYYPSNPERFRERLLRYSKTLPCQSGSVLVFAYHSVLKAPEQFELPLVAEFVVDPLLETIEERTVRNDVSVRAPHPASPVFEGARPGSYAGLRA